MDLTILAPIGAVLALLFAIFQAKKVMSEDEGTDLMKSLSQKIRTGADAYLKRQYKSVAIVFVVLVIIFAILAAFGQVNTFVPVAFVTGGVFSALSGYCGMKIATAANARTANAAHHSLNKGLKVAFSAGSVMGFTVVGLEMCIRDRCKRKLPMLLSSILHRHQSKSLSAETDSRYGPGISVLDR